MRGHNNNEKGSSNAIIIATVIVVVAISNYTLQISAAKDLTHCVNNCLERGVCNSLSYYAACCEVINPVATSNATEAAELVCDTLINRLNPKTQETARDLFNEMIHYCVDVKDRVLFESAPKCNQLPTIDETTTFQSAAKDLTGCVKCLELRQCNDNSIYAACCTVINPLAKTIPTDTAQLVCDALFKQLNPDNRDSARLLFNEIIGPCVDVKDQISFESAPKCNKLPTMRETLPAKCLELLKQHADSTDEDFRLSPCCKGIFYMASKSPSTPKSIFCDALQQIFAFNETILLASTCDTYYSIIETRCGLRV